MPNFRFTSSRTFSIRRVEIGSSPEKGSSTRMIVGRWMIARASATRFTIPPESCPGSSASTSSRPTAARRSWTSSGMRASGSPRSRSGSARLSKTVMEFEDARRPGTSFRACAAHGRAPAPTASSRHRRPRRPRPACGRMRPPISLSVVLFPRSAAAENAGHASLRKAARQIVEYGAAPERHRDVRELDVGIQDDLSLPYFTTRSTISTTSSVWTRSSRSFALMPVGEHRHAERLHDTAMTSGFVSRACSVRSTFTRLSGSSSIHMRPPPAPQAHAEVLVALHLVEFGAGLGQDLARLVVHVVEAGRSSRSRGRRCACPNSAGTSACPWRSAAGGTRRRG